MFRLQFLPNGLRVFALPNIRLPMLWSASLLMCLGLLLSPSVAAEATDGDELEQPNILMIFADDWGWGDLSCHGSKQVQTPNLDKLAKEGTEFYQFTVCSGVCSPSRTALVTGQFPARHSIHQHFSTIANHQKMGMPDWLDPAAPMLPRMLQAAGYKTAHFGKWHLTNRAIDDAPLPTAYGYDEYGAFNLPGPQIEVDAAYDRTMAFMRKHREEPFFINLWIHETHTPHYPKTEWLAKFKDLPAKQQTYAAVVGYADSRIGDVLNTLKELGLEKKTLVIFSSDNGPEVTGNRKEQDDDSTGRGRGTFYSVGETGGMKGRKRSLFAGGTRVPFIVRWPDHVPAGKINKTDVISAVDLLPTFCALAGAKLPEGYQPDGENVHAALTGKDFARSQPIFWAWQGSAAGPNWPRLGVQQNEWKLLIDGDRAELYRFADDWGEAKDISAKHPEVVERLKSLAANWQATLPTELPAGTLSKLRKK